MDRPCPWTDSEKAAADALVQLAAGTTTEEASREASERSAAVLSSWKMLRDILDRHEETLRKRWVKKSKTWRKTVLVKAWPDMPPLHRPDIEILSQETSKAGSSKNRPREPFLWPYINLEDLSREKPLLFLLNTRARNPPTAFVEYEIETCRLGVVSRTIVPLDLKGYIMYMDGQTTDTYGKLVAFGDCGNGFNNNSIAGFQPGDGLLILEIQQKLMEFLVTCCETILNKPADALVSQSTSSSQLSPVEDGSLWQTTETLARYAPYLLPQRPDFYRLKAVLDARASAARDHILALREDPGYFADVVYEWCEHRQEVILDSVGKTHSSYGQTVFWDTVLTDVIDDAYASLFSWNMISQHANHLTTLQKKYARMIDPRYMLPEEFMETIRSFRALVLHFSHRPIAALYHGLPASPPLRFIYVRELQLNGNTKTFLRRGIEDDIDPLIRLTNKIWDASQWRLYGPQDLVDEIERLILADPQQHERISPWVAAYFADLGIFARIKHEVDSYQPWAAAFTKDDESFKTEIETKFAGHFTILSEMHSTVPGIPLANVGHVCDDENFSYPSDKRLSKSNVESMRKSEQNLDLFWQTVDSHYEAKTGRSLEEVFSHIFTVKHELERTTEWIECSEQTSEEFEREEAIAQIGDVLKSMPNLGVEKGRTFLEYPPGLDTHGIKVRGVLPELNYAERLTKGGSVQPNFKLDNRGFRVFKALFYTPSDQEGPGVIPWTEFLYAMSEVGFSPLKLYGSLWHFDSQDVCPIQFHEPRPHSKISLRVAMRIGRRLKRAYGWRIECFSLDKGKGK